MTPTGRELIIAMAREWRKTDKRAFVAMVGPDYGILETRVIARLAEGRTSDHTSDYYYGWSTNSNMSKKDYEAFVKALHRFELDLDGMPADDLPRYLIKPILAAMTARCAQVFAEDSPAFNSFKFAAAVERRKA